MSSLRASVPKVFAAPTVMTEGSLPGEWMSPESFVPCASLPWVAADGERGGVRAVAVGVVRAPLAREVLAVDDARVAVVVGEGEVRGVNAGVHHDEAQPGTIVLREPARRGGGVRAGRERHVAEQLHLSVGRDVGHVVALRQLLNVVGLHLDGARREGFLRAFYARAPVP